MPNDIVRFARTLSREEFVQRFDGMYLVLSFDPHHIAGASFQTAVTGRPKDRSGGGRGLQVVAIAKAPGNPYADRVSVGRTNNCDIVLRDPSVSKLHAHFHRDDRGQLCVVDLRSSNGTMVNGMAVLPGLSEPLEIGDVVRFGDVNATLLDAGGVYEAMQRVF